MPLTDTTSRHDLSKNLTNSATDIKMALRVAVPC